jgi:hypothetical protein
VYNTLEWDSFNKGVTVTVNLDQPLEITDVGVHVNLEQGIVGTPVTVKATLGQRGNRGAYGLTVEGEFQQRDSENKIKVSGNFEQLGDKNSVRVTGEFEQLDKD